MTTATPEVHWTNPADQAWAGQVELQMAGYHNAPRAAVTAAIVEAHALCRAGGRPAAELLGTPERYAAQAVVTHVPVEYRAAADLDGGSPVPGLDRFVLHVGLVGVVGSVLVAVLARSSTVPVTAGNLVVVAAMVATLATGYGVLRAVGNGRLHRVPWFLGLHLTIAAAGGVLGVGVEALREPLGTVPTWLPISAFTAVTVLGWLLPGRDPHDADDPLTAEQWFERLHGLLRGRWFLPRARAQELTELASAAWQQHGVAHPREVFGTPAVHAYELAGGTLASRVGRLEVRAAARAAVGLSFLSSLVWLPGETRFWVVATLIAAGHNLWSAGCRWLRARELRRTGADPHVRDRPLPMF